MVKMRGVQVKAGIFDEKIHDLGVECVCLFVCLVCLVWGFDMNVLVLL